MHLDALGDLGGLLSILLRLGEQPLVPAAVICGANAFVLLSLLLERQGVDFGLDALVVGAQRLQNAPDVCEHLAVIKRLLGRHTRRYEDGKDDVTVVLALGTSHDAANRLHDVHGGVLGVEEDDGIEVGHVDAFRKAAGVGEDAALVVGDLPPSHEMLRERASAGMLPSTCLSAHLSGRSSWPSSAYFSMVWANASVMVLESLIVLQKPTARCSGLASATMRSTSSTTSIRRDPSRHPGRTRRGR